LQENAEEITLYIQRIPMRPFSEIDSELNEGQLSGYDGVQKKIKGMRL